MRKIEETLINAILAEKGFHSSNTKLSWLDGVGTVTLYTTKIATITPESVKIDFGGYSTNTTTSRVQAILWGLGVRSQGNFNRKNFEICFTDASGKVTKKDTHTFTRA